MLTSLLLLSAAAWAGNGVTSCEIPAQAYEAAADDAAGRPWKPSRKMQELTWCLCGPMGPKGYEAVPDRQGQAYLEPRCQRYSWDGLRYR